MRKTRQSRPLLKEKEYELREKYKGYYPTVYDGTSNEGEFYVRIQLEFDWDVFTESTPKNNHIKLSPNLRILESRYIIFTDRHERNRFRDTMGADEIDRLIVDAYNRLEGEIDCFLEENL